jgi:hypothetical protein
VQENKRLLAGTKSKLEDIRQNLAQCKSGTKVVDSIVRMEQSIYHKILILLWQWWSARNKVNGAERMVSEAEICSSVIYHFTVCEKLQDQLKPAMHLQVSSIPPPEEFYFLRSKL